MINIYLFSKMIKEDLNSHDEVNLSSIKVNFVKIKYKLSWMILKLHLSRLTIFGKYSTIISVNYICNCVIFK